MSEALLIDDASYMGAKRRLSITLVDGRIRVVDLLMPAGENLIVERPAYGFEAQLFAAAFPAHKRETLNPEGSEG